MHTQRLLDKIENKLQDSSFSREELLNDLNDALYYVSALHPLPSLQTTSTVVAASGESSVALPANYHCNLYRVENTTNSRVCKIVFNFKVLASMHDGLTEVGSVVDVTAENGILYFKKSPSVDEDLLLYYNEKPETLLDSTLSSPNCIPNHLQDPILCSYILYNKFSEIEDGLEGARNNTAFYWQRFLTAMDNLQSFYPNISLQNIYQRFNGSKDILSKLKQQNPQYTQLSQE